MSQFNDIMRRIPPVTKNLIIINFIVWLAMLAMPRTFGSWSMHYCSLHYVMAPDFNAAQLFTYMFIHSGFMHILFNMFTLYMFGPHIERAIGSARFLFFFIACGIGAAVIQEGIWALTLPDLITTEMARLNFASVEDMKVYLAANPQVMTESLNVFTTVGASGAIYGVLMAFAMLFPNVPMYLYFIPVPVKAKWMVAGFIVLELLIGLSSANDGVAHFAHLGGILVGFIIIYIWKKRNIIHGSDY